MNKLAIKTLTSISKIRNLPEAVNSPGKELAVYRKEYGVKEVTVELTKMIGKLNSFANASRKMSIEQMEATSELIQEEYYYMKFTEIEFVFKNAMKGKYGKLYESLDGFKIMEWLQEYKIERMEYFWIKELEKHDSSKDS